jgi:hypothetical protein
MRDAERGGKPARRRKRDGKNGRSAAQHRGHRRA